MLLGALPCLGQEQVPLADAQPMAAWPLAGLLAVLGSIPRFAPEGPPALAALRYCPGLLCHASNWHSFPVTFLCALCRIQEYWQVDLRLTW